MSCVLQRSAMLEFNLSQRLRQNNRAELCPQNKFRVHSISRLGDSPGFQTHQPGLSPKRLVGSELSAKTAHWTNPYLFERPSSKFRRSVFFGNSIAFPVLILLGTTNLCSFPRRSLEIGMRRIVRDNSQAIIACSLAIILVTASGCDARKV